jgi:predicted nucleotidyltransferase
LKDMTIEVDLREIKNLLSELNKKIDVLIEEKETLALMALAEKSLKDFLEKEPDIYTVEDIKAKVSYT